MKKTVSILLILALAVVSLTACATTSSAPSSNAPETNTSAPASSTPEANSSEPEFVIQLGHHDVTTPDNHNHYFATKFSEYADELTNGRVKIEVLGNGQLGGERDLMEGMQIGSVDMAIITNLNIGPFVPEFMVFDLPFIFKDTETAFKVLDSEVTQEIEQIMLDNLGIRVLAIGQGGFRHVVNTLHPIKTVSDLAGIKMRVPETPLYMETFGALGCNATPMAWTETFTGMQQKTIDGVEIPTSVIYTTRFYEVADYMSLVGHFFSPVELMVSESVWQQMPEDVRNQLQEAATKAALEQRQFISDNEEALLDEMEELGMQIERDVDKAAFQKAVQPVYDMFKDEIGEDFINRVVELAK